MTGPPGPRTINNHVTVILSGQIRRRAKTYAVIRTVACRCFILSHTQPGSLKRRNRNPKRFCSRVAPFVALMVSS
jgi:hypothetical protein